MYNADDLFGDAIPKFFSLQFKGEHAYLEEEFVHDFRRRSAIHTRYTFILSTIVYALFGILDAVIVPEQRYSLWMIRFGIVIPILILLTVLLMLKPLRKMVDGFGFIALVVAGTGISMMIAIAEPPANYMYYAGLILVLLLGYGMLRIRFKWAALAGWVNVLIYEIIAIFIVKTPRAVLINNNFFFISANLIGMLSCYTIESYIRKNFLYSRLLNIEKENVNDLNRSLEKRVEERTMVLNELNLALQSEIDARNQAEMERALLEERLFQARKMESLGTFAGGIAHDFNNILAALLGYAELSLELAEGNEELRSYLGLIKDSGKRAAELVNQILSFARKSKMKNEAVRPDLVLKEVMKFLRSSIPTTVEIQSEIKSSSYIMGNRAQLHQIFMNLFSNSLHAMKKEGGTLKINMTDIEPGSEELPFDWKPGGPYIRISIADTGEGIPSEMLDSIFEPYFSTKDTGEGTGLGLAVVHGIIESYKGSIRVESPDGKGTKFIIRIPVTEETQKNTDEVVKRIPGGKERIMIVDDERAVADYGKLVLEKQGYQVSCFTDSLEAFEIFKNAPDEYDLIISDMMMPHMSGEKLSRQIHSLRKDIPIIICSGYVGEEDDSTDRRISALYLKKPYTMSEMAEAVRGAFNNSILSDSP